MADMNIIVGATDAATPVLRRVRGESDRLGESLRRAAQASSRIGGAAGSLGGRVLGGAAMGGGMGMAVGGAALGLTALTTVLSAIRAHSERQVAIAQRSLQLQQSMQDIQRNAQRAREQVAAGGLSMVAQARQMRSLGGTNAARQLADSGIDVQDALSAAVDMQTGAGGSRVRTSDVARIAQTGLLTAQQASSELRTGQTPEAIIARRVGGDVERARDILSSAPGLFRASQSPIESAVREGNRVPRAQFNDLLRGDTEAAVRRQSNDALDGGSARAMEDLRRQTERSAEALRVAYEAQTAMGRLLNEAGGVISGTSRSAALDDFQRSSAVINR